MKHHFEAVNHLLSEIDLRRKTSNYYFVDTGPFTALALTGDQFHKQAVHVQRFLDKHKEMAPVTTDYVLIEAYTQVSIKGGFRVVHSFDKSIRNSDLKIIYLGEEGFQAARETLLKYKDKDFSLIDCASFNVMRQFGIADVFTFDRHFEQMGFRIIE